MKIEFDSKTVYGEDDKYIKTKIKTYGGRVITNFPRKKMPKEKAPCKCLSIIMLDCYQSKEKVLSSLLEECKYEQENIKVENLTDDDLEKSESDASDKDNDESTE